MAAGSVRVTAMGEIQLSVRWLSVIDPLARSALEVVDFGDRVSIVAKRGNSEVALLGDLITGDVAVSSQVADDDHDALMAYAITVLRARLAIDGVEPPLPGPPTTDLRALASLAGATWLTRGEVTGDQPSAENGR
ncbi:hypothetical protein [Curtobacterium sp. Arg-1]|uniref:hypothetical protein n=1 Tax=Curtobacterium sp. Arg-1 TaxID=2935040 RepID=UPI0021DB225F|nr:hypothetical protein [Curtobacterium sp. Arg-1]UXZ57962.1 hypothetical protein MXD64_00865 [Curtobacterium sp. Arg-1]